MIAEHTFLGKPKAFDQVVASLIAHRVERFDSVDAIGKELIDDRVERAVRNASPFHPFAEPRTDTRSFVLPLKGSAPNDATRGAIDKHHPFATSAGLLLALDGVCGERLNVF